MSTTDPTGEGGGGGGGGGEGEGATTTNVEQSASSNTSGNVQVQAATTQQQQQQQHPPPSPLSGCYLLVVLPEPHTAQHKDLILNRLAKGFLSWDKDSCHVDLEKELLALVAQAPEGEEARNGERLIQYATENLVTEVLIHPQTNTLLQCIRNLLASFTKHRHIIHAGYTFGGNGSWILQDGTFSLADFLDAFSEHEVQRVLRAYENSVTVDIHCAGVGDWTTSRLSKEVCCRSCRVRVNPDDVLTAGVPAITSFTNYIGQYLVPQTLDQLMEPSDVVGNIRFSHPTLYVFPGGQGDAALFGINGFNMLVDGGFARKACFWDFTRHLDRLDAVLVTRINNSNIGGMFSVLRKKKEMHVYPQIGHFFCNLVERRQSNSPDGDKDIDPLIVNLVDIGQEMVLNLRHINLRAHPCYRDPDPINLYHKVGHGTLDMYVLSPSKDSREVREFLAKWHASDSKLFAGSHKKDSNNLTFPIQNLVSICALLVWQPANPENNITRILFPGSTPQHKIFEGFDRLKHLDFLKHPVCSAKTLSPSASLATLRDKPAKQKLLIEKEPKRISDSKKEKRELSESKAVPVKAAEEVPKITPQSTPIIPSKPKTEIKTKKVAENKKIEIEAKESKKIELEKESKKVESEAKESKKIEKELKEVKKEPKKEPIKTEKRDEDVKKIDLIKQESDKSAPKESKESKPKVEPKKKEPKESKSAVKAEMKKSEAITKPKLSEKKAKPSGAEKKDVMKSSPTTPKKIVNGTVAKTEISKTVPKAKPATKIVPSLPAKSAKEANNRKVVEQKKSEVEKSTAKETAAAPVVKVSAKPKPMDRKPISRRTKPVSPSKARMPGSPAKSTRSTPTTSVKSDKDGVIRKVKGDKGTTDSSTVSTPSGIEAEVIKPIDKSLIEQSEDISLDSIESKVLADLKEEREVVEEIEAVLQKAEIEETRKGDRFEGDDEITAEATDKKEEDITEEDVTAEIEDIPKKESSRKESQELTEEDEYLIVEKEEVYTEDSAQSGEGEQKHVLDEAESEKAKILKDTEAMKEKGEKEEPEKEKDKSPEKKVEQIVDKDEKESAELPPEHKKQLQEEVKEIIASATEIVQKAEEKDDSGKKDSEEITKEPSSLSPDKLDSSEKKTTDTDIKPDVDQKEHILEKMEESQERISTIESGATTTAPTLPEDERIPLDGIKEDIDEKHVIEEVKEKDAPAKIKEEVIPETISAVVKPEVKVFDVRQAMQSLQRDIVKTPDEVADLPVHEEVDPKLYRMEDFEKVSRKEEKPSPSPQEIKEPPTPPVKEQKGVFSFFGKVADKFEKGIDKLTKKTKKDTDKDSDDKSSKSSSPKETKVLEKTVLEEVDVEKMFPKVGKHIDKPEVFEEVKFTVADVKIAAIKETAAFIQEEIDAHRRSVPDIEEKVSIDKLEEIKKTEVKVEEALLAKDISLAPVSPTKPIENKDIEKEIELLKEEGEEAEEVKALLEEISNKFKTVKDSLRDSLESLEEKIKEEELTTEMQPSVLKDAVKDTLEGVVEKLEEIKPHIETLPSEMIKEPEKVKFDIPKDEEFEEEYEEEPEESYRDVKEAVRDIGDVLAGTAGINLETPREKPKDVMEIVKKVAEVLKDDDFLSEETLFDQASKEEEKPSVPTDRKPSKEDILSISTERKFSIPSEKISPEKVTEVEEKKSKPTHEEDIVIPRKVGITEEIPVHEEVEEFIEKPQKTLAPQEKPEIKEELCVKIMTKKDDFPSPEKDIAKDKIDAQKICEEMLHDDQHICDQHKKPADIDTSRTDVLEAGIESICVKKVAKRPSFEEQLVETEIEQPVIGFEQKVSPAKAEIVMVTPGSTPTSPKFIDKLHEQELDVGPQEFPKLPEDVKQILTKEVPVEKIIEELIITKKKKITIEIIEYITIVKRIPRERVVYIIEEIIVKKGLRRESVVEDLEIFKLKESITPEKRMEIEEYIVNEYIVKGKRITIEVVEEISIKKVVPKTIVIEIIEEIIVKRKIARHMVLDVPEEVLSQIIKEELLEEESPEVSEAEDQVTSKVDITAKRESIAKVVSSPTEISEMLKKTPEDEKEKEIPKAEDEKQKSVAEVPSAEILKTQELITPKKRKEVEEYIVNEYVTKGNNINIQKLEEICGKKEVSKRIIIEIIEEIIIKRKMPRHVVLSLTEEELSRAIKDEGILEAEVIVEKRKSIAEVPSSIEEKESPVQLKEDKKEAISDQEIAEELSVEEEDIEEEVDGFVSISRRISDEKVDAKKKTSPVKADVSPMAKEYEKDMLDDFEAVEQEYKVRDVPVTSPEKADEIREKEDVEEAVEDTTSDVIEADEKFVQETKEKIGKEELRSDTPKDFKPDKKRELEEPETSEISEIVDTTEKYLDEAKEKTDDSFLKEAVTKPSVSPVSDKTDKPLIEKADELKEAGEKKISKDIIDKRPSIDASAVSEAKSIAPSTEKVDEKAVTDETKEIEPMIKEKVEKLIEKVPEKVSEEIKSETKLADATGFSFEPKTDLHEDNKKFKQLDTTEIKETPVVKKEKTKEIPEEAARRKRSILKDAEDEIVQTKDELEKPKIEKLPDQSVKDDTSTVKRMLVTASSEDGREETEICATGTITFTKTVTPDDSLKDVSVKSTPDKDSLLLDKDSVHSSVSTPRDSISDKSAPEGKDKITSEDSLDKSPVGTRDSQDLEDSLEKSDFRKSKDAEISSINDDKTKVPQKSEDAVKPKSPIEKEDSKTPVAVDKDKPKSPESPKSPVEKVEKPKSPLSFEKTLKTDEIVSAKTIDTLLEQKSPLDVIPEDSQKSKSSLDLSAEKVESAEKPQLPIEMLSEKKGIDVSKTPESLHSEDVSPAETIFSKSPTDKPEMYIAKTPIDEEDVALEAVAEKSPVKEAKLVTDKNIPIFTEKEKTSSPEKDQRPENLDAKNISPKPTSPIVATSALDDKVLDTALIEKSRSPSISSEKEISVRSKSPSIADDKSMQADHLLAHPDEKSRSSSIASVKEDLKLTELEDKGADKSRSSSLATDKLSEEIVKEKRTSIVEKEIIEQLVEPRSSIVNDKEEKEDAIDKSRSLSIGELIDKDISERRKSSIITTKVEEEKPVEKSRSPSITEEKQAEKISDAKLTLKEIDEKSKETKDDVKQPEKLEEKEPVDKSASLVSEKSDDIKSLDKSPVSPSDKTEGKESEKTKLSILESVHDEKGPIDKARSPSAISDKSDEEKEADRSKSPSLGEDKPDRQDVTEHYLEKPNSPIFDRPQSPKVIDKTEESHDKDRSPSVASDKSDSKKVSDRSRSPSISVEKIDLKDMDLSVERTRSPSVKDDKLEQLPASKSPTALQFAEQPVDKSRSSSVVSISSDQKDSADKSPSITDDKSDFKGDTEQLIEKLKSSDQKEDRSKSPSVSGEKPDLKDVTEPSAEKSRSASVISVSGDQKEHFDRSKSPSIAGEKPDLKDVAEQADKKSRSSSVVSISADQKEQSDRSKSPSVAGEKPDLKDVTEQLDEKSRSPGATSDLKEPGDRSKSPSIAEEKPTEKDTLEMKIEKSRSSSVVSIGEQKEIDRSKSPSVISETPDLENVADQQAEKSQKTIDEQKTPDTQQESIDRSKSPSASDKFDDKKSTDDSKSSSVSGDKSDLTDITEEPLDKSKSPSITSIASDRKESIDKVKLLTVLDKKEELDRSLSPSDQSEEAKSAVSSKPTSVAGDTVDLKDVSEVPIDKSRSPSVISTTSDQKETIEKPTSPTAPHKIEEPHDRSKSPSVASEKSDEKKSVDGSRATSVTEEKPDLKDVIEPPADKSRKSSVVSLTTEKAEPFEKSISPTVSDQLEPLGDRSKSSISPSDKSDEKDDKTSTKDFYEDAIDKSPSFTDIKMPDKKHAEEESSIAPKDLDIKKEDTVSPSHDKSRSPSIVLDKPDDIKPLEIVDIDGLKTPTVTDDLVIVDKTRSLSIISDKTEPKSPSEVSRSPSLIDDKIDLKDKSRSSSIASGKLDDIDKVSLQEGKTTERSLSPSVQAEQIPASESAKSQASSPVDKIPKDRSRSQSVFDVGEKSPASRSRTSSLFEDKVPGKAISPEEKDASKHIEKPLDEQEEHESPTKSPVTSAETIEKEMQKIREKRFAEFEEPHEVQSSKEEKSYDVEEDIVKITAEKKADIEKYILEEFIVKKKKISLIVIEKLVMTYVVPQFIVMEIIEDLISRENVSRNAVFDFTDKELSEHEKESKETLTSQKRADVEKYINEEFIEKKKKITPEVLENMVILKAVPRYILVTIIEEIIVKKQIPRNIMIEGDLEARAKSPDEIKEQSSISTSVDLKRSSITPEYLQSHEKASDTTKDENSDGKVSPVSSDRYAPSASPSLSPEPVPSDKSTRGSPPLWEQYKHDEFLMKEKKIEIENLLEKTVQECISKKKKITQEMIREIIDSAFPLSRYIIFEILNDILTKLKISKESVLDEQVILLDRYEVREDVRGIHRDDYDDDNRYDNDYDDLEHDARKSSTGVDMYAEPSERQDKSVTDYPMDYESQFHKAFVSGMTEMRTTHITTLSGKSTPEYADGASGKLPERTLTTTHITKTDIDDLKTTQPVQTVILRESKIAEPHLPEESAKDRDKVTETIKQDIIDTKETAEIPTEESSKEKPESQTVEKRASEKSDSTAESTGEVIVVKKIVKREVVEGEEPGEKLTKVTQEIVEDAPEAITKIIKRETVEPDDKPEVVTKVIKREIIEQDEPEVITKVIRREIIVPDEETDESKEDSGEFVKTITTKTTRTIVTEELPDAELLQTDPSKIYTDPTSGATYRVVSDEGASDTTSSADVKRIVTTVTTITGPDGKITTKKDVKESTDTVDSDEMLEKLIDSSKIATETTKSAEKIIKETITTATSGTSTPDVKTFYDSGKSTPDLKQEDKFDSTGKDRLGAEKFEPPVSPLVRDIISDDKSYSGKSSPDISLPKDIVFSGSTGKSTPEIPMSPLIRDGAAIQPQVSGRSTPDIKSEGRLSSTPEGLRSGEMIRTIITTTKTLSDEGEIVTTTREVTETTNEKGETVILAEKTDVKVDERLSSKDAESAISDIIGSIKSSEMQCTGSAASDDAASEKDRGSPLSEQSSARSKAPHTWGSSEERHTYSDDEPPSSPLSSTSQVGYSPQATRRHDPGSDKEEEQKQVEFSTAAMSSSFYGELPAVPPQMSAMKTFHEETDIQQKSSDPTPIHSRFTVEKEFVGGYGEKPDAKRYVDEADLDFDKALMEHKEMKEASEAFSSGISPRYTNGSLRHESSDSKDHPSSSFRDDAKDDSKGDSKKDPLEGWGTPLGLPSPKPPRKFNLKNPAQSQPSCSSESTSDTLNFDVAKEWGEPLRLPSPAPVTNEVSNKGTPGTPKKERKQTKKVQSENIKNKKRSESPSKNEKKMKDSKNKIQPVYMDLAYVPHHGNSYYTSLDFFKRVRARYYVFSGTEPSREVYDALLEAKKTWEDKDLEVTMIPTYDTDTLGYWVADNEEALAANHIDLSPSASRCTINLQDHETSCSAYRLEF